MSTPKALRNPYHIKDICLIFSLILFIYLLFHHHSSSTLPPAFYTRTTSTTSPNSTIDTIPTTLDHLIFSIASSSETFPTRKDFIRLWYKPNSMRAYVFMDRHTPLSAIPNITLPPILISEDISRFPYTNPWKRRYAIRIARIVKEVVERNDSNIRWFIFVDDDTVLIPENLLKTLSKYDHDQWYYVGTNSERYDLNVHNSFEMAFGGGGFAISHGLARVLAKVLDSCLMRYPHAMGSDIRIFSCLAELGVTLTHESGFHQVDLLKNLFGMLSAHPLSPLISLHHLDYVEPIFPEMTRTQALEHLFKPANYDPPRILQQTVCYDRLRSLTISVSWGYAVQVFEGNHLLPDILSLERTFEPEKDAGLINYMFNTREYPKNPCKRSLVYYFKSLSLDGTNKVRTNYIRHGTVGNCSQSKFMKNLEGIRVFSQKIDTGNDQVIRLNLRNYLPSIYNEGQVDSRRSAFSFLRSMASELGIHLSWYPLIFIW